jgi:hypothetical protein
MLSDLHIRALQNIRTIENLIDFLRDELNWQLPEGSVEDITFNYRPEDLGLKPEHAPKINAIYQVRQSSSDHPWGIFFIDFENKKIPLTILRRIVNHLVAKRRANVTATGRQWELGDLLFMSMYGEISEGMRDVAFAHFHQQAGDLPTLQVIDWHADDTPAALRTTYETLKSNLNWPSDPTNKEQWRKQWSGPFRHRSGHVITTAKGLAEALADLSRKIYARCNEILEAETETGPMTKLYKAFQSALVHDLTPDRFADTFAQTITYGLFSAAVSRRGPEEKGASSLTTDTISQLVPETSPFLREVLETFIDVGGRKGGFDFDEVGVQDVVELLRSDATDMRAILDDFGSRRQGEDPVIHFYEDYLKAYNKKLKAERGVFYTPQPVVSYIIRSVHELLQTEFNLPDGLASTITWREMATRSASEPPLHSGGEGSRGEAKSEIKIPEGTDPDSPFVVILDPATGTATFLVEVIDVIHKQLQKKWETQGAEACKALLRNPNSEIRNSFAEFWNAYVPDHLLPRLYGYELMMAPYAIAHMKVGLKLGETGYRFGNSQRVRIYLTNALEPAKPIQGVLHLNWPALAHEAEAVKAVKETQRFTVVIGNPPYSGVSANDGPWIEHLLHSKLCDGSPSYFEFNQRPLNEPNTRWLNDDYVKFLRLTQMQIAISGIGIAGVITNHSWLENPTFRGMRQAIAATFQNVYLLDLHGNAKKKESAPDGSKDENVFDIQQGVSVSLLVRWSPTPCVHHADLFGLRSTKYQELQKVSVATTAWFTLSPDPNLMLWRRMDATNAGEYESLTMITDIFSSVRDHTRGSSWAKGLATTKDHLFISFDQGEALYKIGMLQSAENADSVVRTKLDLEDTPYFTVAAARHAIRKGDWRSRICKVSYRPFDSRVLYWHPELYDVGRGASSKRVMSHLFKPNLALVTSRMTKGESFAHAFVSRLPVEVIFLSSKTSNNAFVFPLKFYPDMSSQLGIAFDNSQTMPNFSAVFLEALGVAIGRRFEPGSSSGGLFAGGALLVNLNQPTLGAFDEGLSSDQGSPVTAPDPAVHPSSSSFSPVDVFHYIYGVLHSPAYRSRYAEFLKIDFPRIPLPGGAEVFDALVPLGAELVALHLMESPALDHPITTFVGNHSAGFTEMTADGPRVEKVSFTPLPSKGEGLGVRGTVWIDKAQTRGFRGVPEAVWNFQIGGYQVCEKWLKDRGPKKGNPGRILTPEDITHYHRTVVALTETIRIMAEIDEAIEKHGGWPHAFKQ